MFLRRLVGVAAVVAVTGVAAATNTKIKEFSACGGGTTMCPNVDGMAQFKFDATTGNSTIHVHMQDLPHNGTFAILVFEVPDPDLSHPSVSPDFAFPALLSTNPAGNGSFDGVLQNFDPEWYPNLQVMIVSSDYDSQNAPPVNLSQVRATGVLD
jgi:hypothetical protein